MTAVIFGIIAADFFAVAAYFIWRYLLHRNPISLGIAFMALGWTVAVARELHMLPRDITTVLMAAALSVSLFLLVIIGSFESQQPRPFR